LSDATNVDDYEEEASEDDFSNIKEGESKSSQNWEKQNQNPNSRKTMREYNKANPRSRMSMPQIKGYEVMLRTWDKDKKIHKWVKNKIRYTEKLGWHYSNNIQILEVTGWLTIKEYNSDNAQFQER